MDKDKFNKIIAHYAKRRAAMPPRPEQTDEEKRLTQEQFLREMKEMEPMRQRANA